MSGVDFRDGDTSHDPRKVVKEEWKERVGGRMAGNVVWGLWEAPVEQL